MFRACERFCRSAHVRQRSCNCESVYARIVIHAHAHPHTISLSPFLSHTHSVCARTQQSQKNTSSSAFSLIPGTCMQIAQSCPRLVLCLHNSQKTCMLSVGTWAPLPTTPRWNSNKITMPPLKISTAGKSKQLQKSGKNLVWLRASWLRAHL